MLFEFSHAIFERRNVVEVASVIIEMNALPAVVWGGWIPAMVSTCQNRSRCFADGSNWWYSAHAASGARSWRKHNIDVNCCSVGELWTAQRLDGCHCDHKQANFDHCTFRIWLIAIVWITALTIQQFCKPIGTNYAGTGGVSYAKIKPCLDNSII